jgi:hypothetical protein
MKKTFKRVLIFLAFLSASHAFGQVQLLTSFNYSGNYVKLEKEGYKFYLMDVTAEQCRIYNSDFSLWKTVQLNIPNNRYLTDIQFLSQNLFDTDDGIELLYVYYQYVQTSTSYYYIYTTCVIDDNGTVILEVPGGSWTEVKNMDEDGARLLIYVYDYSAYPYTVKTQVYKVPGKYTGIPESGFENPEDSNLRVYPNPTTDRIHFNSPKKMIREQAWLTILDAGANVILRQPVQESQGTLDLKSLGLPAGTYYVRVETSKLQTKFQKVILAN